MPIATILLLALFSERRGSGILGSSPRMFQNSLFGGCPPTRRLLAWVQAISRRAQGHGGRVMKRSIPFGVLVALIALALSGCGGDLAGGGDTNKVKDNLYPSTNKLLCPRANTTPRSSSLPSRSASPETTGGSKALQVYSATPSIPTICSFRESREGEIAFFNLRKVQGVYKPMGPNRPTGGCRDSRAGARTR